MRDSTHNFPPGGALCADCGAPTSIALVDLDDVGGVLWLCRRCIVARYSTNLGRRRTVEL